MGNLCLGRDELGKCVGSHSPLGRLFGAKLERHFPKIPNRCLCGVCNVMICSFPKCILSR